MLETMEQAYQEFLRYQPDPVTAARNADENNPFPVGQDIKPKSSSRST